MRCLTNRREGFGVMRRGSNKRLRVTFWGLPCLSNPKNIQLLLRFTVALLLCTMELFRLIKEANNDKKPGMIYNELIPPSYHLYLDLTNRILGDLWKT